MSCVSLLLSEIVKWAVPLAGAYVAVFQTHMLDNIKFRLNLADLRSKQFEEFACDLSSFIFHAELTHEFYANNWDANLIINDYNIAVTTFRTKEFVYLSWARRFWSVKDYPYFEDAITVARIIDEAIHAFNDGESTPEKIEAIDKAIAPLRDLAQRLLAPVATIKAPWYRSIFSPGSSSGRPSQKIKRLWHLIIGGRKLDR